MKIALSSWKCSNLDFLVSPEAPVPIVRVIRETESLGGAANVALNLAKLGIKPLLAGFIGQDPVGEKILSLLKAEDILPYLTALADRPTIHKTRILGGHQQMLRIDRERKRPITETHSTVFLATLLDILNAPHPPAVIILSDYAKGTLTEVVCQGIIQHAKQLNIPVLVDPKGDNYAKYRGATTLSPNRKELSEAVQNRTPLLDDLLQAGENLRKDLELEFLTVTLSELGIALMDGQQVRRIPAMAKEVFDVSGAGDTVISTLAAGLAAGLGRMDALHLANLAAGVVVAKVGTCPIEQRELLAALSTEEALNQSDKIRTLPQAMRYITAWQHKGERLVFTNGCFDLLHAGHVDYLEKARQLGSRLIVGLNTDRSIRALKGPTRPIICATDRARVLAALASVDMVILFDEDTPLKLITALRPHILAKGADYTEDQVVGGQEVKSWGGQVSLVPLVEGLSTSHIVDVIRKN
ncbi:MAG: D-glycero-beta-D-manno-heptose 1-phosphate adenylyltransferase [Magnetococcus sp. DMHC-6]